MKIIIKNSAGIPIYEQIKEQIKSAIIAGELKEEEALPSIRQLARDLKISVITTTRAYNDLESEGFVASVQGKGFFVLPQNSELHRENALRDIETGFSTAIDAARRIGVTGEELHGMLDNLIQTEE